MTKEFKISAKIWKYQGKAAWHFVNIPSDISHEIDDYFSSAKRGWGSLPVTVTLGNTTWETSIFTDKKTDSYLLPLKKAVRIKEHIQAGDNIHFALEITAIF